MVVREIDEQGGELKTLTDAPATIKGIDEFIEHEHDGDPYEPAGDIRCCTKSPVLARARHARCNWIWVLCDPTRRISACKERIRHPVTHCNSMNTALKSKKV